MKSAGKSRTYRCPLCGKTLTKSQYEKALEIHTAREKHLRHLADALKERQRGFKRELEKAKQTGRDKE
jgi:tRNA(Ile2) C34 agmatinyltransferase TiaS